MQQVKWRWHLFVVFGKSPMSTHSGIAWVSSHLHAGLYLWIWGTHLTTVLCISAVQPHCYILKHYILLNCKLLAYFSSFVKQLCQDGGGKVVKWCICSGKWYGGSSEHQHRITNDSAIPLRGRYHKELKVGAQPRICTSVFTAAWLTIAEWWEQPRCPSTDEWMNKTLSGRHITGYHLVFKRKEIMALATTCIKLEDFMLGELSQSQKTNTVRSHWHGVCMCAC